MSFPTPDSPTPPMRLTHLALPRIYTSPPPVKPTQEELYDINSKPERGVSPDRLSISSLSVSVESDKESLRKRTPLSPSPLRSLPPLERNFWHPYSRSPFPQRIPLSSSPSSSPDRSLPSHPLPHTQIRQIKERRPNPLEVRSVSSPARGHPLDDRRREHNGQEYLISNRDVRPDFERTRMKEDGNMRDIRDDLHLERMREIKGEEKEMRERHLSLPRMDINQNSTQSHPQPYHQTGFINPPFRHHDMREDDRGISGVNGRNQLGRNGLGVTMGNGNVGVNGTGTGLGGSGQMERGGKVLKSRMSHILSEQRRRESINSGFDRLRALLPVADDGMTKAQILQQASDYILKLESRVQDLSSRQYGRV
ncbi:hypothetical protein M231_02805 [Tremella mesenterica]|uniref:BHLH domain-containing protein n=1 Tax=Tremella mesenterica TaxID=5217 RepID=A0A4Q1BPN9_TREME|nr:hypothetical protein M231_02805 [Tremella mesenterica]